MFQQWLKERQANVEKKPEQAETPAPVAPAKKAAAPRKRKAPATTPAPSIMTPTLPSFWDEPDSTPAKAPRVKKTRVKAPADATPSKKGYCRKCKSWNPLSSASIRSLKNGAAYIRGTCPTCSKGVSSFLSTI
jgi:Domain of unknown function (DUF5679)